VTADIRAVFFDVDFTLICPGPMFGGEGYRAFCARYGMDVDAARFAAAVAGAAPLLDGPEDAPYDAEIFVAYTRRIIEQMGGSGDRLDAYAREIYDEWAACRHFELYDDVPAVLPERDHRPWGAGAAGPARPVQVILGLRGGIEVDDAEDRVDVDAPNAVMVGDSIRQDVEGALRAGMRAVLLHRGERRHPMQSELARRGIPVIRSLTELPNLVIG